MSLNPLAPAFLPRHQSSSDPPLPLCNSHTMNLPLAQLICGMPPPITPSHAPSINQHIADNTLLQPMNQYTKDAAAHKPTPLLLVLHLILPLTLSLMLTLTLTLTLTPTLALTFLPLSRFPALEQRHFAVLPRWALWGQPKQKQTTLQTTISNPYPTRKTLRYRTSHQEFANWKNCLPMKCQRTHQ